jgi:Flp pilus assembly protein CpaB
MVRRTYVRLGVAVVPSNGARRGSVRLEPPAARCREGEGSVKRQTLILVMIGVILFIAGSAIAFASVKGASKQAGTGGAQAPVSTSAVVAKSNIPAGTTGQEMVSSGMVAIELIPTKSYSPTDLGSLSGLNDQVLTQAVTKGHAISSTQLTASTSSISLPTGMNAVTVALSGTQALAGYLQPGAHVDVYANIKSLSTAPNAPAGSAGLPVPCTELAMADIEVLDVQSTAPTFSSHPTTAGRTVPATETLLLAMTPDNARTMEFLSQNEAVSVVQTQKDLSAPPVGQCIGTDQTTSAP